ncbi:MAG: DUF1572 family protein [Bacteroidetes bacterium]|nr:DUF1572 family protein [Bacteroidota bacterium]
MLQNTLIEFFERDLKKLKEEISQYPDDDSLWKVEGFIANSAGNLCLHLIGNMNHFVGAVLGKSGYVRDRESEFSMKNITRGELTTRLDDTIRVVKDTVQSMKETDFTKTYPVDKHGKIVDMDYMLVHLATHLNYHLGQVNYHRRLLVKK